MSQNLNDMVSGMYAAHFDEQDALEAARTKRNRLGKAAVGLGALGLGAAALHTDAFPEGARNLLTGTIHGIDNVVRGGSGLIGRVLDSTEGIFSGEELSYPGRPYQKSSSKRPEIKEDEQPTRLGRLAAALY